MTMITKLIEDKMLFIRSMGRAEIAKAHAVGRPGVYVQDGEIVAEYPDGEIVDLSEHRRRISEARAAT